MAENKASFILYSDLIHTVSKLPDETAGKLLKHILEYVNDKDPQTDDLLLQVVFEPVKLQLKRDLKSWETKREVRSDAGKKGMEVKWGVNSDRLLRSERLTNARKIAKHTPSEWAKLLNLCENKCVKCGSDEYIVKDHIIPIYQGGSDGIENLQPLCRSCNSSKGADNTNFILKTPNKSLINAYHRLTNITVTVTVTDNDTVNVNVNKDYKELDGSIEPSTKKISAYKLCTEYWLKVVHPTWSFTAVHGKTMKTIVGKIEKMQKLSGKEITPETTATAFQFICSNLPDFFNDKDLQVINSKFNEIIEQIKNKSNGTNKKQSNYRS